SVNGFGETTSQELVQKLLYDRDLNVSRWTVQRQLKRMGYKSTLPLRNTNVCTEAQRSTCSMGNPTQR
ncbi:unnamed protein product, partial [Rotaria socialis]